MTKNPEEGPLNEWLFDEYIRVKEALKDLTERHENLLHHLTDVCRRNDRMQAVGDCMRDILLGANIEGDNYLAIDAEVALNEVIQKWGEANV